MTEFTYLAIQQLIAIFLCGVIYLVLKKKKENPNPSETKEIAWDRKKGKYFNCFIFCITYTACLNFDFLKQTKEMIQLQEMAGTFFTYSYLIVTAVLTSIPLIWITYHCAYKLQGTSWLLFLILSPICVPLFLLALTTILFGDLFFLYDVMLSVYRHIAQASISPKNIVFTFIWYANLITWYRVNKKSQILCRS